MSEQFDLASSVFVDAPAGIVMAIYKAFGKREAGRMLEYLDGSVRAFAVLSETLKDAMVRNQIASVIPRHCVAEAILNLFLKEFSEMPADKLRRNEAGFANLIEFGLKVWVKE